MARKQVVSAQPPSVREYHVYDVKLKTIGGTPIIKKEDGTAVVLLTREQARFFIDQAIIGEKPFAELGEEHRELLHQFTAGRVARDQKDIGGEKATLVEETETKEGTVHP